MSEKAKDGAVKEKKQHFGWILAIYLTGLFIGALDTGIITPARTIIQNSLGVDDQLGIWMITIYTLCYAAIIPISGKLADRHGRKIVFIISIFLFGSGSLISGLSGQFESFYMLLFGRVVQAIGAGGIMPIATAEFGTSFPEEKRGMALGLVGGVFGIANVLGATAGSAILDVFGTDGWEWIFYINIPICAFVIITSIFFIPNHKAEVVYKIDKLGTLLMTMIILALLYGLKNIDFFDFPASVAHKDVYPFLIAAAVLIPLFVIVEKKAEDPVFHIEYMKSKQIVIVLAMGLLVGCSMMGMIFIPQFAENALKIPSGDGGYFVIILGLFAGMTSMMSGKLIDKIGSKPVLGSGFVISIIGALYLAFIATKYLNLFNVIVSLILIGLGLGLAMGTPLNYMMLKNTKDEDSNSALATLSLVRSIGTAIAPAIMVGFIAQAGMTMQDDLMKVMPDIPEMPKLEQQDELKSIVKELSKSDEFKKQMKGTDLEKMLNMEMDMDVDMTGSGKDVELPEDLQKELQDSDVTTITAACKDMAKYMFETNTPSVIKEIQGGINKGVKGIKKGIKGVDSGISEMQSGIAELESGKAELQEGINGISNGINGMNSGVTKLNKGIASMTKQLKKMKAQKKKLISQRTRMKNAKAAMTLKISQTESQRQSMQQAYNEMSSAQTEMTAALAEMQGQKQLMVRAKKLMIGMRNDIPKAFKETEEQYLDLIDENSDNIEGVYQKTLNKGFKNMYICVMVFNIVGFILLLFYKEESFRKRKKHGAQGSHGSHGNSGSPKPEGGSE